MKYLGNSPYEPNFVQRFNGNGSTTVFTLSLKIPANKLVDVFLSGIYQNKNTYTTNGNTVTFSTAPETGTENIEVIIR